ERPQLHRAAGRPGIAAGVLRRAAGARPRTRRRAGSGGPRGAGAALRRDPRAPHPAQHENRLGLRPLGARVLFRRAARIRGMRDAPVGGAHDPGAGVAESRAVVLGDPPGFTDYAKMLAETRPDFVIALVQHRRLAETAHYLLDHGHAFLMEKPLGVNADEVES